jgi:hypothetical protein
MRLLFVAALACTAVLPVYAVELVTLQESNWDEFAALGKEVDAIYGDFVLRNDEIVAVIAFPRSDRKANMMTREVGGCIIDLTLRDHQSDQIQCYYPGGGFYGFAFDGVEVDGEPVDIESLDGLSLKGESITFKLNAPANGSKPGHALHYTLEDGANHLAVRSVFTNGSDVALALEPRDTWRNDDSKDRAAIQRAEDGDATLAWTYDKWFGQAYGLTTTNGTTLTLRSADRWSAPMSVNFLVDGKEEVDLAPGGSYTLDRVYYPAKDMLAVQGIQAALTGSQWRTATLRVTDANGDAVPGADVDVLDGDKLVGYGVTDGDGNIELHIPGGDMSALVRALGHEETKLALGGDSDSYTAKLNAPAWAEFNVTNADGGPTPCKVQFIGKDGTGDPFFGPDSGIHAVRNAYYSHDGTFRQKLDPGKYDVLVSYGNEYDAATFEIETAYGQTASVEAVLQRAVDSPGWVSADFHSHSSPSGDNASSQRGRVLNLLAEHIEFAPCTEHQRIDSYDPHLEALGATDLLATCTGMELTSSPGDLNHHNAFPLIHKPRTQDGGAPQTDQSPEVQIERIALWDDGAEKLVQQNHPSIGELFFDKDGDGEADAGYDQMFGFMDVIEVHPPVRMFEAPFTPDGEGGDLADKTNNRMFEWVQTINQGHRVPGVVNTDAHANYHGSGWLRNYIKSQSDDPAQIDTMDMVRASERGNVIMTNAPYLEVEMTADGNKATAGDDLSAPDGKTELRVRVQCANWYDVDRVQLFVNGRPDPSLNFTRESHPDFFEDGVVKFDHVIPLELESDAHIIVGAIGENSTLGPVAGPRRRDDKPVAVANPIFVDVDGGGFKANGDTLGFPLASTTDS